MEPGLVDCARDISQDVLAVDLDGDLLEHALNGMALPGRVNNPARVCRILSKHIPPHFRARRLEPEDRERHQIEGDGKAVRSQRSSWRRGGRGWCGAGLVAGRWGDLCLRPGQGPAYWAIVG